MLGDPRASDASQTGPLTILYQDEFLVAIDKPAGMVVHSTKELTTPEWVVMKRLRDQLGQKVYPAHRLDRPTCGVLLFALDEDTLAKVQADFAGRTLRKTYLAVVDGETPDVWGNHDPIEDSEGAKETEAHTAFQRLAVANGISLVKCFPTTGRFHQIRRHLAGGGFPIVGDYRYGEVQRNDELSVRLSSGHRMLLQAKSLELKHVHHGHLLYLEAPEDPLFTQAFKLPGV